MKKGDKATIIYSGSGFKIGQVVEILLMIKGRAFVGTRKVGRLVSLGAIEVIA